ncbi:hypothetical protein M9458_021336, partial [Cirrhinus mrigala]
MDWHSPSVPLRRTSPAPLRIQSPASSLPHPMEHLPEPTADKEPEPAMMLVPETTPEPIIAPEPEHNGNSDQVCEPATSSVPVGVLVQLERMEWGPADIPVAESELQLVSVGYCENLEEDMSPIYHPR